MTVRSYLDLAFFVCVMHADEKDVPAELQKVIEAGDEKALERLFGSEEHGIAPEYKKALWNPDTHLHECIHFWQGLTLPFLYCYSLWAFRTVIKAFVVANRLTADLHQWRFPMPRILNLISEPLYAYVSNRGAEFHERDKGQLPGYLRVPPMSALDLLETAASITQWKLSKSTDNSTVTSFRRWSKRNPAYTEMLDRLVTLIQDEDLALEMFLPLCNTAFQTTNPVMAFVLLAMNYMGKHHGDERVLEREMKGRIETLIDEIVLPAETPELLFGQPDTTLKREVSDLTLGLLDLPFYRFSMASALALTLGPRKFPHPTLHLLASRWLQDAQTRPEMLDLLDFPSKVSSATVKHCFENYQPLILARFHLPRRTRIVPLGRLSDFDYVTRIEREASGTNGSSALMDLYMAFGAVRRATNAFYSDDMRLCSHRDCPEYNFNYCNSWIFIPDDYRKCRFLEMLDYIREQFRTVGEDSK